jgi:hypothetical protein
MTTKISHRNFVNTSVCAGLATAMTTIVCWSILASTATVRWMGSDALTAPPGYVTSAIMSVHNTRMS